MVRAGILEKVAMKISGHKTRAIFDPYNIVDNRDIEAAGKKLAEFLKGRVHNHHEKVDSRLCRRLPATPGAGVLLRTPWLRAGCDCRAAAAAGTLYGETRSERSHSQRNAESLAVAAD